MQIANDVGVSLSGGGYRATAFHIGTLRALHKMGVLQKVDVLSTISGGSITGAYYCLHKGEFEAFEEDLVERISTKNVIGYILTSWSFLQLVLFTFLFLGTGIYFLFTDYAWLFLPLFALWLFLLLKFQFRLFPAGKEVEKAYDQFYFGGATLKELCTTPTLAIGSSNLQTGRPFTFSYRKMGDSTYSYCKPPISFLHSDFPVARAVAASSCVPFAFTPIAIKKKFYKNSEDYTRINPKLIDGGVYDNQGIHKLAQKNSSYACRTIITSDAGGKLSFNNHYNNVLTLLIRTVDLFMNRIEAFQMQDNVYNNVGGDERQIAYFSLAWDIENCIPGFVNNLIKGQVTKEVIEAHHLDPDWLNDPIRYREQIEGQLAKNVNYTEIKNRNLTPDVLKEARGTGTNLTPLSKKRILALAQHAENLTELQVKLYCPQL